MKIDRHGKAKILSIPEIQLLFNQGLQTPYERALFGICLFTACRINEAVTLNIVDVYDTRGRVRPKLIIRKGNTKRKLATRTIPVIEDLRLIPWLINLQRVSSTCSPVGSRVTSTPNQRHGFFAKLVGEWESKGLQLIRFAAQR